MNVIANSPRVSEAVLIEAENSVAEYTEKQRGTKNTFLVSLAALLIITKILAPIGAVILAYVGRNMALNNNPVSAHDRVFSEQNRAPSLKGVKWSMKEGIKSKDLSHASHVQISKTGFIQTALRGSVTPLIERFALVEGNWYRERDGKIFSYAAVQAMIDSHDYMIAW